MEAAFFDLDKTIISRSSSLALSRPLYRAGMVSRGQLLRGAYAQLVYLLVGADEQKMERLKEGMLQLTKGWDRAQVERLVQDVILEVIDPYVYQESHDLIALHQSEGRRIYVVSSSPEEVVRPLARHFGVARVIATLERALRRLLSTTQDMTGGCVAGSMLLHRQDRVYVGHGCRKAVASVAEPTRET